MHAASGALPPSCLLNTCDTAYPVLGTVQVRMLAPMPCHAELRALQLCWAHIPTPDSAARAGI